MDVDLAPQDDNHAYEGAAIPPHAVSQVGITTCAEFVWRIIDQSITAITCTVGVAPFVADLHHSMPTTCHRRRHTPPVCARL